MSAAGWKDVQVVVYTPGEPGPQRLERTIRLPASAGLSDLLTTLESIDPEVYAAVRHCIDQDHFPTSPDERVSAVTHLDRYFTQGGPVLCPILAEGS